MAVKRWGNGRDKVQLTVQYKGGYWCIDCNGSTLATRMSKEGALSWARTTSKGMMEVVVVESSCDGQ